MLSNILDFADEFDMLPETGTVLVCVSGGADSMCLLEALLDISSGRGYNVAVAHFNHRLRGGESDRDEAFVGKQCELRGVPFYSGGGDVRAYAKKQGLGIEAAARDMRYGFFFDIAANTGAVRIATAHTADDNAETILLNLVRGAGANGLSGIPPKRDIVIRPMLRVTREDVMRFIGERDIRFVEDSTNDLEIFTRNKIRRAVMPVLREINPRFCEAAASVSELSRADEEYLSSLADEFIREQLRQCGNNDAECKDSISSPRCPASTDQTPAAPSSKFQTPNSKLHSADVSAGELYNLPFAVSSRVIRKLYGGNLSHKHVRMVLELCGRDGPPAGVSLPGMTVYSEYGRIVFGRPPCADSFPQVWLSNGDSLTLPGLRLKVSCKAVKAYAQESGADAQESGADEQKSGVTEPFADENQPFRGARGTINKSFTSFLFKTEDICGKMTVRSRREGDIIRIFGRNGAKTLKKLFIERRIPARERAFVPVVADDAGVLAVYGVGVGDRAVPQPGDEAFQIIFEESI